MATKRKTAESSRAKLPESPPLSTSGAAGQDICEHCERIYTAYTLMWTCANGCCRFSPAALTPRQRLGIVDDNDLSGWTHICKGCTAVLRPEERQQALMGTHG